MERLSDSQLKYHFEEAVALLQQLIAVPSFSKEEDKTAGLLSDYLEKKGFSVDRQGNNVWALAHPFNSKKPTILLNSHHDTVKPNSSYTRDPFGAEIENEKLYGLGSNDAGGALVSLMQAFCYFSKYDIPVNLLFAATAEEEISGENGISAILSKLPAIDLGIVGEPTGMRLAVAEKGLMVLDCYAKGEAGHAARQTGKNAIYEAMKAIQWFRDFRFEKMSDTLGPVLMQVTMVQAGSQHNVVPDRCHFVVDVRSTDAYSQEDLLAIFREKVDCEVVPRSTRLKPSKIPETHAFYRFAKATGMAMFGSPTLSDQALMPFPTCKIGPGLSERSHTADEFILLSEIKAGIEGYIRLLEGYFKYLIEKK